MHRGNSAPLMYTGVVSVALHNKGEEALCVPNIDHCYSLVISHIHLEEVVGYQTSRKDLAGALDILLRIK